MEKRRYIPRLKDAGLAIYATNKLTFVLTSLFFRGYKLRAFIRFTGACPPVISRTPANNANAIGERERRAFRCMRERRKTPIGIVIVIETEREKQRKRERKRKKENRSIVQSLDISAHRYEPFRKARRFVSTVYTTDFAIDLMRL